MTGDGNASIPTVVFVGITKPSVAADDEVGIIASCLVAGYLVLY